MNKSIIKDNGFECTQCKKIVLDRQKHNNEEDICDQCKIENLEKQLAITEKALELACSSSNFEETCDMCEYQRYIKTEQGCPCYCECEQDFMRYQATNYFKEKAKEMLENEK